MFFLHLVFLSRSEACFFSIWFFWVAQKHVFSPFGLSAPRGSMKKTNFGLSAPRFSMKKRILNFPRRAEARKNEFWPFRAARKHEKLNFGLSAPRGNMKKRILVFPRHAEAWKNDFWPFRAAQLLFFYSFRLEILIKFEMSVLKNISICRLFLFFSYLCYVLFENNLIIIATQVKLVFWLD